MISFYLAGWWYIILYDIIWTRAGLALGRWGYLIYRPYYNSHPGMGTVACVQPSVDKLFFQGYHNIKSPSRSPRCRCCNLQTLVWRVNSIGHHFFWLLKSSEIIIKSAHPPLPPDSGLRTSKSKKTWGFPLACTRLAKGVTGPGGAPLLLDPSHHPKSPGEKNPWGSSGI